MILYPAALLACAAVAARSVGSIVGTLAARRQAQIATDALLAQRDAFEREAMAEIEALVSGRSS